MIKLHKIIILHKEVYSLKAGSLKIYIPGIVVIPCTIIETFIGVFIYWFPMTKNRKLNI